MLYDDFYILVYQFCYTKTIVIISIRIYSNSIYKKFKKFLKIDKNY